MPEYSLLKERTGFTGIELDALSHIYDVAAEAGGGKVVINNLGGNIFYRLRDTDELNLLLEILNRRFPDGLDSVNWELVERGMGCYRTNRWR